MPLDAFKPAEPTDEPALTHIALVLDESGSMLRHRLAVVEGVNTQVRRIREEAQALGDVQFSGVRFNHEVTVAHARGSLDRMTALSQEAYMPNGGTSLYDAIGETIGVLLQCPKAHHANTAFLVTVFTDGEELNSTCFSQQALQGLLARLTATGRWTFAVMGPTGSVQSLGDSLNIPRSNLGAFDPMAKGSAENAFSSMAEATSRYLSARGTGVTSSVGLYDPKA